MQYTHHAECTLPHSKVLPCALFPIHLWLSPLSTAQKAMPAAALLQCPAARQVHTLIPGMHFLHALSLNFTASPAPCPCLPVLDSTRSATSCCAPPALCFNNFFSPLALHAMFNAPSLDPATSPAPRSRAPCSPASLSVSSCSRQHKKRRQLPPPSSTLLQDGFRVPCTRMCCPSIL